MVAQTREAGGGELGEALGADLVEAGAELLHDINDIRAGLADDVHRDGGVTERADETPLLGEAQLNGGDVLHAGGDAVADGDDEVLDLFDPFELSHEAYAVVALALGDGAGGDGLVLGANSVDDLEVVESPLGEGDLVDKDTDLAFASSEDVDLGDAVDAFEEGLDLLVEGVEEGSDVEVRVVADAGGVDVDDDPGDGVLAGPVGGLDAGLLDFLWVVGDLAEVVGDFLEDAGDGGVDVELELDDGLALGGGGLHALEVGDVLELFLLVLDDLVDDFLW